MLAILLLATVLSGDAGDAAESKVWAPTKVHKVARAGLRRVCPEARYSSAGCTRFRDWRLTAQCTSTGGAWSMMASARYDALVYVAHSSTLAHELQHAHDVRLDVVAHVRELEAETFGSEAACRAAAEAAERGSKDKLREFAQNTRSRRD